MTSETRKELMKPVPHILGILLMFNAVLFLLRDVSKFYNQVSTVGLASALGLVSLVDGSVLVYIITKKIYKIDS